VVGDSDVGIAVIVSPPNVTVGAIVLGVMAVVGSAICTPQTTTRFEPLPSVWVRVKEVAPTPAFPELAASRVIAAEAPTARKQMASTARTTALYKAGFLIARKPTGVS